ncbi:MAG: YebC/PmpR family DNA-binding transcriptional regulator [Patescibacteria group bacterium]
MAGHNKWTQIKRQKEVVDKKKSKIFSILARILTLEAKQAKGDRNALGLKKAIEKARLANVPNDNIERAIARGLGGEGGELETVVYEAYGPGGTALLITGITDNKNRTSQEIKHLLTEHGASLAPQGSVTWAFTKTNEGLSNQPAGWQANNLLDLSEADQSKINLLHLALENHEDIEHIYDNCRH